MDDEKDNIMIDDESIAIEDSPIQDSNIRNIISFVFEKYKKAEDSRHSDEQRWLKAYRFIVQMFNLLKRKNQEFLLKLQKQKL